MINEDLLNMLVCPKCKKDIELDEIRGGIFCPTCRLFYEIKDGIPIMLIEKATKL